MGEFGKKTIEHGIRSEAIRHPRIDLVVVLVLPILGWALLVASWNTEGSVSGGFNLLAAAAFTFGFAWLLSGKVERGDGA